MRVDGVVVRLARWWVVHSLRVGMWGVDVGVWGACDAFLCAVWRLVRGSVVVSAMGGFRCRVRLICSLLFS